ncbi:MAG: ElyC/SanA/YdcF family protein [Deltaproteobacteria bacterium]|nr:ElyC/SanA/YdcF family protein [Deltaproteobacteria bacterium]
MPGSKLILSGTSWIEGFTPVAKVMADTAREWGVRSEDMVIETQSRDTEDHAVFVKEIVGDDRFVLVTSASHMPRAMGLFRAQGLEPIAAPTEYMVKKREGGLRPGDFFPSAGALEKAERAIHEYLGLLWSKIRGQI